MPLTAELLLAEIEGLFPSDWNFSKPCEDNPATPEIETECDIMNRVILRELCSGFVAMWIAATVSPMTSPTTVSGPIPHTHTAVFTDTLMLDEITMLGTPSDPAFRDLFLTAVVDNFATFFNSGFLTDILTSTGVSGETHTLSLTSYEMSFIRDVTPDVVFVPVTPTVPAMLTSLQAAVLSLNPYPLHPSMDIFLECLIAGMLSGVLANYSIGQTVPLVCLDVVHTHLLS